MVEDAITAGVVLQPIVDMRAADRQCAPAAVAGTTPAQVAPMLEGHVPVRPTQHLTAQQRIVVADCTAAEAKPTAAGGRLMAAVVGPTAAAANTSNWQLMHQVADVPRSGGAYPTFSRPRRACERPPSTPAANAR